MMNGKKITRQEAREIALRGLEEQEARRRNECIDDLCDACDPHAVLGTYEEALKDILRLCEEAAPFVTHNIAGIVRRTLGE